MNSIRSVQIEKHVLAGFLKYPQVYFEVSHFINENDFSNGHKTILRALPFLKLVKNHLLMHVKI
jgi:hypothetical protein